MNLQRSIISSCILMTLARAAASAVPTPGPPELGPIAHSQLPVVLVLLPQRIAPENPFATGMIGGMLKSAEDNRYHTAALQTGEAIRKNVPTLDLEQVVHASFRCGEPGSICSEMKLLETADSRFPGHKPILDVLESRQWDEVRVLAVWFDQAEKGRLTAHASITDVSRAETQLEARNPVYASYVISPHEQDWEPGAPVPRESALRTAVAQLEPMLKLAMSWGVNNDRTSRQRVEKRPLVLKYRDQGIECKGVDQCNVVLDSVVGDRVWSWRYLGMDRSIGTYKVVLRSRMKTSP